ncbi:hypothetical protein FACS189450_06790 [Spirochaetia bacterium]|nr:hypothetical protein FACS189450_06790 [Spirochaetia bacterium]GHU93860.1 hypothetical protein FACS189479_05860 [Spirochaetia bacterium]
MAIKMKMRDLTIAYAGFALIFCAVLAGLAACQIEIGLDIGTPTTRVDTGPTTRGTDGTPSDRYTGPAFISYYNPDAVVLDGAEPQTTATRNVTVNPDGTLEYGSFLTGTAGEGVKSITLTGSSLGGDKTYLIGRAAPNGTNVIVLNLAADGKLQFRPMVDSAIPIGSYAEFQLINTARAGTYKQEANLDLMGMQWEPVGGEHDPVVGEGDPVWLETTPFTGRYDGNNRSIRNIYIKPPEFGTTLQGLFGYLDSGSEVKKLSILSGTIDTGHRGTDVGSIAGRNKGTISECNNAGVNVTGGTYIGGIAGRNEGEITRCYNATSVTGSGTGVGGIVGSNKGDIIECYNEDGATVRGNGVNVGGIAGFNEGAIEKCYNKDGVTVIGYHGTVGGIAGSNKGAIFACYNEEGVTVESGQHYSNVGGIAGLNESTVTGAITVGGTIIACYNKATVIGGINVGGVAGDAQSGSKIQAVYNTGAVTGTDYRAGGVIGILNGGEIKACYNTGTVSGGGDNQGGVIGFLTGQTPSAGECFWDNSSIKEPVGDADGYTFAFGFSGATNFPAVSKGEWGTGDGSGSGKYWKAGTTGGGRLPKLWFE